MLKCNLTEEEKAEIWPLFSDYISTRQLELTTGIFKQYIFYDTWGRKNFREYFCPSCGHFEVEKTGKRDIYQPDPFSEHHGDSVTCPICGHEGELICLGRMKSMNSLWEEQKVIFFQAMAGKLLVRAGWLARNYDREDLNPVPRFHETARYYVSPGKRQMWKRSVYNAWGRRTTGGWESKKSFNEPFPRTHWYGAQLKTGEVYGIGMERIEDTDMKFCMLEDYVADTFMVDGLYMTETVRGMVLYLGEYTRRPQLEMLVKLGHHDVVTELLNGNAMQQLVNWKAKSPQAFFRMSKQDYKVFRETGGKLKDLAAWKDMTPDMPLPEFFRLKKLFGRDLAGFMKQYGNDSRFKKLCKWYERQKARLGEKAYGLWRDTLNSERELGNNIDHDKILMPEDLRARHDETAAMVAQLKKQREEELVKEYAKVRFRQLQKQYAWSNGEMMIRVPTCAEEVENEGRLLRHCVAGYADRHIKGKTTILFLRWCDDPETPYMTMEINGADIRQIHGYKNDAPCYGLARPREIHGNLLDEWTAWIRKGSPRTTTGKPVRIKLEEEKTA